MTVHNILSLVFICLIISIIQKAIADVCVMKTPCSCVFPNGTGYDLSPSEKPDFYRAQMYREIKLDKEYELSTYYLHPCSDILPTNVPDTAADTCNGSLSLYRKISEFKTNSTNATGTNTLYQKTADVCNYLGSTTEIRFSPDGQSIIYDHKPSEKESNIATIVRLMCTTKNDSSLYVTDLSEPNNIVLSFYSKEACLKELETGGRSVGSTLLIIFFSFLIFYLVLGICTKKFLMGATGIEVIPNLTFWTDLPNLVKDGWVFLMSGCRVGAAPGAGAGARAAAASPDPRSYDSI